MHLHLTPEHVDLLRDGDELHTHTTDGEPVALHGDDLTLGELHALADGSDVLAPAAPGPVRLTAERAA